MTGNVKKNKFLTDKIVWGDFPIFEDKCLLFDSSLWHDRWKHVNQIVSKPFYPIQPLRIIEAG